MKILPVIMCGVFVCGIVYRASSATRLTCQELGYDKSGDTSICAGALVKCPLDLTKFNCVSKSEIINSVRLDWNKIQKCIFGPKDNHDASHVRTWSAPKDGVIFGAYEDIRNVSSYMSINNKSVAYRMTNLQGQRGYLFLQVNKGDSVRLQVYLNDRDCIDFVPYVGQK